MTDAPEPEPTTLLVAVGGVGDDPAARDALHAALLGDALHARLAALGATRLRVNLDDALVDPQALRLDAFAQPVTALLTVAPLPDEASARAALAVVAEEVARVVPDPVVHAWRSWTRTPLEAPEPASGERTPGLANLAFLRRPDRLTREAWLAHWHGEHTEVAMATQATSGYVQDVVVEVLTDGAPPLDGVVEELFPEGAAGDLHAFYGSGGDDAELGRRLDLLMASVHAMGADEGLHLLPTSRYVVRL